MKRFKTVDAYIQGAESYHEELLKLREILQGTELTEEVKWGAPCYTYDGKNVVGIGAFKSYFGLWFHQGALLEDKQGVLINAQEGVTKALRQWRMETVKDIKPRVIKSYVKQAIELVKAGKEIKPDRQKTLSIPKELKTAFGKNKKAKAAFDQLTKGKQREYAEYIDSAKQEKTKLSRLEKIMPMIESGVGLNDKYRNC